MIFHQRRISNTRLEPSYGALHPVGDRQGFLQNVQKWLGRHDASGQSRSFGGEGPSSDELQVRLNSFWTAEPMLAATA